MNQWKWLLTLQGALVLLLAALPGRAPGQGADKNAELAKKAVDVFVKAVITQKIDAVMPTVDVPWADNLNLEASKLLRKPKEVEERLDRLINGSAMIPKKVTLEFKNIWTYEKVLEKFGKALPESERKVLDEVLKKTDYVLHVAIRSAEGEVLTELSFLVAIRDGKGKVVGLRN
jgi:hypothetical protein